MESPTPEQQVEQFKTSWNERRAEVEQKPAEQQESEYETTSRITEQAIQQEVPDYEAASHAPRSADESLPPDEQAQLKDLIAEADNKGPYEAIKKSKGLDAAVLDAFQAALTGVMHEELTKSGKLEEVR